MVNPNSKRIFPRINIQNEVAMRIGDYKESSDQSVFSCKSPIQGREILKEPAHFVSFHNLVKSKTAHDVMNEKDE